ncbi:hypothetical protein FRC20_006779 [Serendipita sp. 405]|nr:hypothetical protein FRC20_006779 [Serendipita sp. 405]
MAAPSPRKFVPLAPGHDPTIPTKSNAPSAETAITKRAFFAAVVVEEDLCGISEGLQRSVTTRKRAMTEGVGVPSSGLGHKRTLTQTDNLQEMIKEMVTTERNYVKRLRILKQVRLFGIVLSRSGILKPLIPSGLCRPTP